MTVPPRAEPWHGQVVAASATNPDVLVEGESEDNRRKAMLDKVYGQARDPIVVEALEETLDKLELTGTLYIGYPVLATADAPVTVDAMLVCDERGLVIFCIPKVDGVASPEMWQRVQDEQDLAYRAVETSLRRHANLWKGRRFAVQFNTVSFLPVTQKPPADFGDLVVASPADLSETLSAFDPIDPAYRTALNAALERVSTIKPPKRRSSVTQPDSRGAILKRIEQEIANLDTWQKRAAIESPDGPQRIRGLAGSGKTVVLALKAAYLHFQHPDWNIALTFHTRSLYQQLTDLVRRFSFEHQNEEPDWSKLRIMHAWGSVGRPGVYAEIASHCGAPPRDYLYAKTTFGSRQAFAGVCGELLSIATNSDAEPIYDVVLIDEAQDLPWQFFKLVLRFTKPPKRIVWAYDELQNLTASNMPSEAELFGLDGQSGGTVSLRNADRGPRADVILPVCYRNTPWALTVAHALGFGVYRREGLVQHFDDPALWEDVGYTVEKGELALGREVRLRRNDESYPAYFKKLLQAEDAVTTHVFEDELEQAEWVAKSIKHNLSNDELDADDVLIILPNALAAKRQSMSIMNALARRGLESHVAGVTQSQDELFRPESIAISHIHRAKGNEAPMVYALNADFCAKGFELARLRNILFTAITRSKAWVRLCGIGDGMRELESEINAVRQRDFRLEFTIPTEEKLRQLRTIHRDRPRDEIERMIRYQKGLKQFVEAVQTGEISLDDLPADLKRQLRGVIGRAGDDDEDADPDAHGTE